MERQNSWLAFVDSGAVDNVLPKSVLTEYPWRRLPSHRAELVLKEQTGHTSSTVGSDGFESSAGSNMNTTWEVADVRKPLISASCVLERSQACVGREAEDPVQEWRTQLRLRGPVVCSPYGCGGLNTNRIKKKEPVRPHTLKGA